MSNTKVENAKKNKVSLESIQIGRMENEHQCAGKVETIPQIYAQSTEAIGFVRQKIGILLATR